VDREPPVYRPSTMDGPLRQGEIVSNLVQVKVNLQSLETGPLCVDAVTHPFAVVMTQDCDLDWDFKARHGEKPSQHKLVPSVLFCEVHEAATVRHMEGINSTIWAGIKKNKNARYQFLEKVAAEEDAFGQGLPEMTVDFKRFFTIPTDEAYYRITSEARRRCKLVDPYLQHFVQRFYHFQLRIALPEEHHSE